MPEHETAIAVWYDSKKTNQLTERWLSGRKQRFAKPS